MQGSTNAAALRAAAATEDDVAVEIDDLVADLPHFTPDLEDDPLEAVVRFRVACQQAAGVLLAVPEYAYGIPGAFKNALDWTVATGCLNQKPVAPVNVAPPGRAMNMRLAIDRVMQALGADIVHHALPVERADVDAAGATTNPRFVAELRSVVAKLAKRSYAKDAA
jgi:chromate reductase